MRPKGNLICLKIPAYYEPLDKVLNCYLIYVIEYPHLSAISFKSIEDAKEILEENIVRFFNGNPNNLDISLDI